jgi:hypothetical protein
LVKRVNGVVLVLVLAAAWFGLAAAPQGTGAGTGPWAVLVGPDFARYVPGTEEWNLTFRVVGDGWTESPAALSAVEVNLNGRALAEAAVRFSDGPWARVAGRLTQAQVLEVRETSRAGLRGEAPAAQAVERLEAAAARLASIMGEVPPAVLTIAGVGTLPEGSHWVEVSLSYEKDGREMTLVETMEVAVTAIPRAVGWFSADLHIHSYYSDGNKWPSALKSDLASMGYYIGYLTDHTAALISGSNFTSMSSPYPVACKNASDLTTSLFPGIEMGIGHKILGVWNGDGHTLGYGVSSTSGLNDNTWGAQAGLDQINGNNTPQSSSGIAHPTHLIYNWEDWTVLRYYGIELMSGVQSYFDIGSGPATRWRSECARLAGSSASYRPSVRTGSDYHSGWQTYVTHVKLASDSTWNDGTWEQRWAAVDSALKNGKTTISRKGSLAYITADGYEVGSTFTRASGTSVNFTIYFKPVVSGTYNLTLYRDNCAATVWSRSSQSLTANTAYIWSQAYSISAGTHYYWLYVSGPDYCYTTPIYIKQ